MTYIIIKKRLRNLLGKLTFFTLKFFYLYIFLKRDSFHWFGFTANIAKNNKDNCNRNTNNVMKWNINHFEFMALKKCIQNKNLVTKQLIKVNLKYIYSKLKQKKISSCRLDLKTLSSESNVKLRFSVKK